MKISRILYTFFIVLVLISGIYGEVVFSKTAAAYLDVEFAKANADNIAFRMGLNPEKLPKITVVTLDDDNKLYDDFSSSTPDWGIALAIPSKNLIILKENRPNIHHIFKHEISHIYLHYIMGNNIPRWFDEGVAEYFSKQWNFGDDLRIAISMFSGVPRLVELEGMYLTGQQRAGMLYQLSHIAVSQLVNSYGERIIPSIAIASREYDSFEKGFYYNTGITLDQFQVRLRKNMSHRYGITSILFNANTIWFVILFLFLILGSVKIYKNKQQAKLQAEEELNENHSDMIDEEIH